MGADIDGETARDTLGMRNSVDMSADGKTLAVGANQNDKAGRNAGHVRVFEWTNNAWQQKGADIQGKKAYDYAGSAVDLSSDGNVLAVGAHAKGHNFGHVRVYEWNSASSSWTQKGTDIIGEEEYDYAGASIDLSADGQVLAVGAYKNDADGENENGGHVRVFQWASSSSGGDWILKGLDIDGEEMYDSSGVSVSLAANGDILAIGAHENSDSGYHAGHVRIFEWAGSSWTQMGKDIDGESQYDYSGSAIDLNAAGNIVAIGAYKNDGAGSDAGHVRVYEWNGRQWVQMGADIDGEAAFDNAGVSVDLSGDGFTVAVGAWGNDNRAGQNAGHARIYTWNETKEAWDQKGAAVIGEARWDQSGSSVDLSADGHILAVGARYNDGTGRNSGHVRVWSTCADLV